MQAHAVGYSTLLPRLGHLIAEPVPKNTRRPASDSKTEASRSASRKLLGRKDTHTWSKQMQWVEGSRRRRVWQQSQAAAASGGRRRSRQLGFCPPPDIAAPFAPPLPPPPPPLHCPLPGHDFSTPPPALLWSLPSQGLR